MLLYNDKNYLRRRTVFLISKKSDLYRKIAGIEEELINIRNKLEEIEAQEKINS